MIRRIVYLNVPRAGATAAGIVAGLWIVLVFASFGQSQSHESMDVRTIKGLQQRRLFDLARIHAELAIQQSSRPVDKVTLAVVLLETLTHQAATVQGAERQLAWSGVAGKARQLVTELANAPRSILLTVQASLIDQARLEQLVREIEVGMGDNNSAVLAQELARSVQRDLEQIRIQLGQLLNQPDSARGQEELSGAALLTLRYNIEYQATRALMQSGLLYEAAEQASRADVMVRVERQLQSVLQSVSPDQPIWWTIQGDRLAAARAIGDWAQVSAIAAALPEKLPDSLSRDRIQAELILVRLAQNRTDEAVKLAGDSTLASSLPELDIARLRLFALLARQDPAAGGVWQQRALELTRQIESAHGGYWGRRASLMVVGTVTESGANGNLELLVRVAAEAQRKMQWPEAIKALDAACAQSMSENNRELAYKLGFRAAAIQQDQKQFPLAAERFESLAMEFPENADAHSAHLMACWNLSRTVGSDKALFDKYQQMLEHNIQTWPASPSADQTRIWLAAVHQRQREYGTALGLLANVKLDSPLLQSAIEQLRLVIPLRLAQAKSGGEDTLPLLTIVARQMESVASSIDDATASDDTRALRHAAVSLLGELRWLYGVLDTPDVVDELEQWIKSPGDDSQKQRWRVLQIVRAAFLGEPASAIKASLDQLAPDTETLELLRIGLTGSLRADKVPTSCQSALLAAADHFESAIQSSDERHRYLWDSAQIQVLVDIGDVTAIEQVEQIALRYPRDKAIQQMLGELLLTASDTDISRIDAALSQWRKIANATRQQSDEWFEAKLNVARLLIASNQRDDAKTMLEYMQAVPPGWKDSAMASEFDRLLAELKK